MRTYLSALLVAIIFLSACGRADTSAAPTKAAVEQSAPTVLPATAPPAATEVPVMPTSPRAQASSTDSVNPVSITSGKPFILAVGQEGKIDQLQLRLVRIVEDSRCPKLVNCVWAGQVVAEVAVTNQGKDLGTLQLTLPNGAKPGEKAEGTLDGWRVQIVEVDPYPTKASPIDPKDYRVTLLAQQA